MEASAAACKSGPATERTPSRSPALPPSPRTRQSISAAARTPRRSPAQSAGRCDTAAATADDTVTIEQTATITDDVFAALGNGVNVFLHNGTINGDFKAVSKNADDSITVGDTGTVAGTTTLGPGDQTDHGHGCGGGEHGRRWRQSVQRQCRQRPQLHRRHQHDKLRQHQHFNHHTTSAAKKSTASVATRVAALAQSLRRR